MSYLYCVIAGLAAGVIGGLFGVAGGIIMVPFLVLALKLDQHTAQGTSLLTLAMPVVGLAAYNYYREGDMVVAVGVALAVGIASGGLIGSKIALGFSPTKMRRAFSIFLIVAAVYMIVKSVIFTPGADQPLLELTGWVYLACYGAGMFAGIAGGLFGIGGGIVIIPFMLLALGFPQHLAQGTSLLALSLPVAAFGAYNYHKKGNVHPKKSLALAAGLVAGGFLGSTFALDLPAQTMQYAFAGFVILTATYLILKK